MFHSLRFTCIIHYCRFVWDCVRVCACIWTQLRFEIEENSCSFFGVFASQDEAEGKKNTRSFSEMQLPFLNSWKLFHFSFRYFLRLANFSSFKYPLNCLSVSQMIFICTNRKMQNTNFLIWNEDEEHSVRFSCWLTQRFLSTTRCNRKQLHNK